MPEKVKDSAVEIDKVMWYQVLGSRVWSFLNSLKLTLFILITLAVVSIAGTVVQQNRPVDAYLAEYGEKWTQIILYLQLNDMYHSPWFLALLTLLVLNIVVCTIERFPPKWRSLLKAQDVTDLKFIDRLSNSEVLRAGEDRDRVREKLVAILGRRGYRVKVARTEENCSIYAWRGIIGRFGADVTHVSLIIILLGAIVGNFYGYTDFRALYVGGRMIVPEADFELRLDDFWIDYYDTGQIRQYNSMLTVIENGKEVFTKQIWVNEPLYYKGIRFYQASWGTAWDRVEVAQVALKRGDRDSIDDPVLIKWGELKKIPDSDYSVKVVGYVADFAFDEKTRTVFSKSAEARNPALRVEIYRNGELVSTPWLFLNYPGIFSTIPGTDDDIVFVGYKGMLFSGISINKDPGTNIVWAGTIVMGIGFYLAFFVYHRRVWVNIRDTGNSSEVRLGGMINKNQLAFEREFKELVEEIKKGLSTS